jgi:hypothetical protein
VPSKIKQAVTTNNDRISQSKIWANVGSAIASWAFIYMTLHDRMTWEIFFAYLGTVAGFTQISKFLSYKYGTVQNVADTKDNSKPSKQQESDKFEPGD